MIESRGRCQTALITDFRAVSTPYPYFIFIFIFFIENDIPALFSFCLPPRMIRLSASLCSVPVSGDEFSGTPITCRLLAAFFFNSRRFADKRWWSGKIPDDYPVITGVRVGRPL
jgi:hypothetical protein